jgi:hypothetical protein
MLALTLAATANAQEFGPALELSTIEKTAVKPLAFENQVSGQLTSGQFGGQAEHQTGIGIRLGGYGFGIGASFRHFFGGPLGIQAEVLHYGFDSFGFGYSSNEFQGAVIYRFNDIEITPDRFILTPYAGGGISHVRNSYDDDFFFDDDDFSDNDTGAVILGGAEVFFAQVPRLGVSGQFSFNTNDTGSFGGAGGTVAAHWYFK